MRKSVIDPLTIHPAQRSEQEWLELEQMAQVEVTSEEPNFPIESALASGKGPGWRAREKGKQIIRIIFDKPRPLHRIRLSFRRQKLSEPRNSLFNGRPSQAGHSEILFASNGASALMARRARSKIIRSIWIASPSWSWLLGPTSRRARRSQLWASGASYNARLALQHSDRSPGSRFSGVAPASTTSWSVRALLYRLARQVREAGRRDPGMATRRTRS
jgi:hypothetical protein